MESCGRCGRVVGRGSVRRRREAAAGRGREGRALAVSTPFPIFCASRGGFPLTEAGYGSDGV